MFRIAVLLVFAMAAWTTPAALAREQLEWTAATADWRALPGHALVPQDFARALLAETNRVRRAHGRRPLRPKHALEAAADDQAAFMALRMHVQHGSFLSGQATAEERVNRHGVYGIAVAENVAAATLGEEAEHLAAENGPPMACRFFSSRAPWAGRGPEAMIIEPQLVGHQFRCVPGEMIINEYGVPMRSPFNKRPSTDILRINHYISKSREELVRRRQARQVNTGVVSPLTIDQWIAEDAKWNQIEDAVALRYVPRVNAMMSRMHG